MKNDLNLMLHTRTALIDGCKIEKSPEHIATEICYARKNDQIIMNNDMYIFAVGTYSLKRDLKYKESYCYLPESAWVTYNKDLFPSDYFNGPYVFTDDCYYKICFKRVDGKLMEDKDLEQVKSSLTFTPCYRDNITSSNRANNCFDDEIHKTILTVKEHAKTENDLKLIVLTDTHNVLNGTWRDTEKNIESVSNAVKPDAIIHLGDLSDGIVSKKRTLNLACEVIEGLKKNKVPFYLTLGNHDANYFWNNKETISIDEQSKLYLERERPYYYVDIKGIRLIFLLAYDNDNEHRYGFIDEEVIWLESLLKNTDKSMKVMIFSHDAPLAKLDYWSDYIYNGDKVIKILEDDNTLHGRILCFIHGHTHADYIYEELSFPIVSIGCNKCEDFKDYKPEESYTWARNFDHVSQDLWDYLVISKEERKVEFVRFGAGEDRSVN